MVVEIRINLKTFWGPLGGPESVFCDNNEVVNNTSIPKSTLSKKHNTINYHYVHKAAVAWILRVRK